MKNCSFKTLIAGALALVVCATVSAETVERTISGEGACSACILKERGAHVHEITVTETAGGNAVTYYLMQNDVTRQFGTQLCRHVGKVIARGNVAMVDGRLQMTPARIKLVKD